jgi:large subunit ribosomal protein L34e
MKSPRFNLIKKSSYSTIRNRIRLSKTPGNKIKVLYLKKKIASPICNNDKIKIKGVKIAGLRKFSHFCKRKKKVSRAYGGCLSAHSVKERIKKAFLIEEQGMFKKYPFLGMAETIKKKQKGNKKNFSVKAKSN